MRRTVQEIADDLGVEKVAAEGLVRFLLHTKLAKFKGERPSPSGRGKGQHVYEVLAGAGAEVAKLIERIEN